jgi:tetratricopeptide (TPR) repeat protein
MSERHFFLQRLDLPDDADERSIRRAYARELKLIDQEADPAGFQSLREAYDIALMWSRRRPDEDDEDIPPPAPAGAAPAETMAPPAPETAAATAAEPPPAPAKEQPPAIDEGALGGAVFTEFLERCQGLAGERAITDAAVWEQALRAGLADTRLISIMAREVYEYNVAALLAHGWQPGHEALLVAAIQVFQWDQDRRRVLSLGQAGHMLDAAIDQRTMFDLQSEAEQERQRKLVLRLRQPKEPSTRELVIHGATIETMIARFPEWLALIVSVPTVVHWRERNEQVPNWRRKLTFTSRRKLSEKSAAIQGGGFNWGWLVFLVIMGLSRLASHASHDESSYAPPRASAANNAAAMDLVKIGKEQLDRDEITSAYATLTKALERDPNNAVALSSRAVAAYENGDYARAESDAQQATKLDKSNPVPYRVRGMVAKREQRYNDALADFTRAIQLDNDNSFTYYQRAVTYEADNQVGPALADAEQAIRLHPTDTPEAYGLLARLYHAKGDINKAAAQAEAMIAALPKRAESYTGAAYIYTLVGKQSDAFATLDRGMKTSPDITLHTYRARLLPPADTAGRKAAIQAALAMNPRSTDAMQLRAALEYDTHQYQAAVATYTGVLSDLPANSHRRPELLLGRGLAYTKLGQREGAKKDFQAAREASSYAPTLNTICWELATRNIELKVALDSCDTALAMAPKDSQVSDSRGFVLLRLARYEEAVKAYDAALAIRPTFAYSLYGRGIAKNKLSKHKEGDTDIKAALAADDGIGRTFAAYRITP